jgi:hypothetical protein
MQITANNIEKKLQEKCPISEGNLVEISGKQVGKLKDEENTRKTQPKLFKPSKDLKLD